MNKSEMIYWMKILKRNFLLFKLDIHGYLKVNIHKKL